MASQESYMAYARRKFDPTSQLEEWALTLDPANAIEERVAEELGFSPHICHFNIHREQVEEMARQITSRAAAILNHRIRITGDGCAVWVTTKTYAVLMTFPVNKKGEQVGRFEAFRRKQVSLAGFDIQEVELPVTDLVLIQLYGLWSRSPRIRPEFMNDVPLLILKLLAVFRYRPNIPPNFIRVRRTHQEIDQLLDNREKWLQRQEKHGLPIHSSHK